MHHDVPFHIVELNSDNSIFTEGTTISSPVKCGTFLCKSGVVELSTDSRSYRLTPGCLYIYIVAGRFTINRISPDAAGLEFEMEIETLLRTIRKIIDAPNVLHFRDNPLIRLEGESYGRIDALMTDLYNELNDTTETDRHPSILRSIRYEILRSKSERLVYEIIYEYVKRNPMMLQPQDRQSTVFIAFLLSLFKNFREKRDIAFYAGEQCLSTRYFSSIIRNKSGRQPSEIIENMVIGEAKQLLLDPHMSIKEVAIALNFPTQTFFGKYFKLRTGMSPKEFRAQHAANISD